MANDVDVHDRSPVRARWRAVLAAALVAFAAGMLAPDGWPAGEGRLEATYEGHAVGSTTVTVGSDAAVRLTGVTQGAQVTVVLPEGLPLAATVEARVTVERDGRLLRPPLDAVTVTVLLPDGQIEAVPVLTWDTASEALTARRHPPDRAGPVLALLAGAVVLWVTAAVPLAATALAIPVGLAVTGATSAETALAPFFHPIIALFLGGFLMAEGMRRAGLDRWAAHRIVGMTGQGPVRIFAGLMLTAAFLSMWMSNTAAVAVLIPIALAVAAPWNDPRYTKVLVLGCAYAATLGGIGSAIGTPANLLAIEYLGTYELRTITFAGWFGYGLPMVVLFLPVIGYSLWRRYGVQLDAGWNADRGAAVEDAPVLTRAGVRVLVIFGIVAAAWLLQGWHGAHPGIVALAGAVALLVTGDVDPGDLGRIDWSALLTFGAGLSLGLALTDAGVADWVASRLSGLSSLPDLVAVAAVGLVTLLLTTVASNTASAATLIPLAIPLASLVGVDPTQLVLVVAIASSVDFALIIGTPPTMLAYATGLFRPVEILRAGVTLDLAALVILVTIVPELWQLMGLT